MLTLGINIAVKNSDRFSTGGFLYEKINTYADDRANDTYGTEQSA